LLHPAQVKPKVYTFKLMIDIQRNRPIILDRKVLINKDQWRGTIVEFTLEGDYLRAMPKILEYFKQTAMVNPYANLTFVDPKGRLYKLLEQQQKCLHHLRKHSHTLTAWTLNSFNDSSR